MASWDLPQLQQDNRVPKTEHPTGHLCQDGQACSHEFKRSNWIKLKIESTIQSFVK
jgi:hypothetical protein